MEQTLFILSVISLFYKCIKIKLLFFFTIWCWYLNLQNVILFWWQHCCFTKIGQSAWPTLDIYGTQCFKGTEDIKTLIIYRRREHILFLFLQIRQIPLQHKYSNKLTLKKSWVLLYIVVSPSVSLSGIGNTWPNLQPFTD